MSHLGRVLCIGTAGVACLLGGCGDEENDSRTVDAAKLEQEIEQSLPAKTTKVSSVSCPEDVKNETGTKFTCRAKLSGDGTAEVAVTVTPAPNEFSYSVKPGTAVLSGASIDKALEKDLAANDVPGATVNCPAKVTVKPGTTVTCSVTGGGGVGRVSFEFSDASGSIDGSSVKTES